MNDGINIVFYIFNKFIDFLFNQAYILEGVSLGWIIVICSIFMIIFNSILNTPTGLIKGSEQRKATAEYRNFVRTHYKD